MTTYEADDGLNTRRGRWTHIKEQHPQAYLAYKLSIPQAAELCRVHPDTIRNWIRNGMDSKLTSTRVGNLIRRYRRISLKGLADYLAKHGGMSNGVENRTWTPQEIKILKQGYHPEFRSRPACILKRHRLRKEGKL